MYDVFDFQGCIVDRVNLREQVVWCHPPQDEDTQMMAEDYVRMALAKVEEMDLPEPFKPEEEMYKDILIVGGGISGMTAALETAKAGYNAVLVEKEQDLGGFQKKVSKIAAFPYKDIQDNNLNGLIEAVKRQ